MTQQLQPSIMHFSQPADRLYGPGCLGPRSHGQATGSPQKEHMISGNGTTRVHTSTVAPSYDCAANQLGTLHKAKRTISQTQESDK